MTHYQFSASASRAKAKAFSTASLIDAITPR